jgi:sec-independent protein translocase protein TatC
MSSEMSFLGHLSELRKHLFRMVIAITIGSIFIAINLDFVMNKILFAPTENSFPTFRFFNFLSELFGSSERMVMPEKFPIQVRRMYEQVNVAISVSVIGGIVLVFPYIIYELWKFIAPALSENEKKNSLFFIFGTSFFFILGVLVGYFLICPLSIQFGYFFQLSDKVQTNIDLSNYIDLIVNTCLGMGVVFLLPIIAHFLTLMGILTPHFLKEYRRHALVVILVIAAIITPPDASTMIIATIPLYALYELSVLISVIAYKKINS